MKPTITVTLTKEDWDKGLAECKNIPNDYNFAVAQHCVLAHAVERTLNRPWQSERETGGALEGCTPYAVWLYEDGQMLTYATPDELKRYVQKFDRAMSGFGSKAFNQEFPGELTTTLVRSE
jgi:hypothetical protein